MGDHAREAPAPGRPRSEAVRQAILDAALALLREQGAEAATIKAIAARAGAGRQTIYRWWPGLGELILEALAELGRSEVVPGSSGDFEADLRLFLTRTVHVAGANREALRALMVLAQGDEAFAERFWSGFVAQRRAVLQDLLSSRMGSSGAEVQAIVPDLVFGPLWYRILDRRARLDRAFAAALADAVLALLPLD